MISFIFGIITGLFIASLIFLCVMYFRVHEISLFEKTEKFVKKYGPKQQGEIIYPISPKRRSLERMVRNNDDRGLDTPLEDIIEKL